jgi:hypothetical protein
MVEEKTIRLAGETYVLRLYHRKPEAGKQELLGLLEDPLSGRQWSFCTMDELKRLLKERSLAESE